jgi:hypothetical protein
VNVTHIEDDDLHEAGGEIPSEGIPIDPSAIPGPPPPPPPHPFEDLRSIAELGAGEDWLTLDPPEIEMLFRRRAEGGFTVGVVPRGQVMVLAAEGGTGKTFASLSAAIAVSCGADWLGHFEVSAESSTLQSRRAGSR